MYAETNQPYPNRIQLVCTPFVGPFVQDGPLGAFDPRRDIEVWIDGVLTPVQTFTFDVANNRYLLYMSAAFNLQGVIQLVHHVPDPPFSFQTNPPLFDLTLGDNPNSGSGGA
jgi:hypothetical protein